MSGKHSGDVSPLDCHPRVKDLSRLANGDQQHYTCMTLGRALRVGHLLVADQPRDPPAVRADQASTTQQRHETKEDGECRHSLPPLPRTAPSLGDRNDHYFREGPCTLRVFAEKLQHPFKEKGGAWVQEQ